MPRKTKKELDLDFEIRFFENILRDRPDFDQALIALGEAYTRKGLYQEGLKVDEKLARLRPDDPMVLYNLACSYSLLERVDESLSTMKAAIFYGYEDFEHLKNDADLLNLRQDKRFTEFLVQLKGKESSERS